MPHHEESPEKPQYNMAAPPISRQTPPILPNPPFSSKTFQPPPPFPSILKKLNPPLYEGGGGGSELCVSKKSEPGVRKEKLAHKAWPCELDKECSLLQINCH